MFEIGPEKIMVILAVVFIFLGPKELPGAVRKISVAMRKLRSLQDDLRAELGSVLELPASVEAEPTFGISTDTDHSGTPGEPHGPGFSPGSSSFL
jgi:Sec-independent protein translocase protein TatA